jgi:hypothetical protein
MSGFTLGGAEFYGSLKTDSYWLIDHPTPLHRELQVVDIVMQLAKKVFAFAISKVSLPYSQKLIIQLYPELYNHTLFL